MSREERVGPALMVGLASSNAGALVLLAQDGAQASADEAVEDAVQGWRGMLEVAKPSPKHRVEVGDNPLEAVAPAADRPRPHLVLEHPQALLAHQPAACLEPVAKELEPLSRLSAVPDPCLVWMEGQAVGRDPRLDLAQGGHRLRFRAAQDHEVVGGTIARPHLHRRHRARRRRPHRDRRRRLAGVRDAGTEFRRGAKAGIYRTEIEVAEAWIPAFAGMTRWRTHASESAAPKRRAPRRDLYSQRGARPLDRSYFSSETFCMSKNICVGLSWKPLTSLRATRVCSTELTKIHGASSRMTAWAFL